MLRLLGYFARYQGLRMKLAGLPSWAKPVLLVCALPGLLAVGLSIVALVVSILALLVCVLPVLWALRTISGSRTVAAEVPFDEPDDGFEPQASQEASPGRPAATVIDPEPDFNGRSARRPIEVRIVE